MLNDQRRPSDPDSEETTEVVETTETPVRRTERVERVQRVDPAVEQTRVEVDPESTTVVNELGVDPVERPLLTRREVVRERRYSIGKTIDVIWYLLGLLEVLLAARFFFKLTAANSAAGFVTFINGITGPFVFPFNGIFPIPREGNNVFDTNILIAMIVYAVIFWGITRLLAMTIEPPSVR
jgi:hypothetical protein